MGSFVVALVLACIGAVAGFAAGWTERERRLKEEKRGFSKLGSPENMLWLGLQEALRLKIASQSQMLSEVKRLKQMEVRLEEWLEQMEGTGEFGQVGFRVCEDSTEQAHRVAHVVRAVLKGASK